ncbi:MAG: peroxidase [Pseudonocardiales bacterium]|nr:MAG: peroxidase [Pseudonocardiales bacterium]
MRAEDMRKHGHGGEMSRKARLSKGSAALTVAVAAALLAGGTPVGASSGRPTGASDRAVLALLAASPGRTLDGLGNNVDVPSVGQAGTPYRRVAPATYADGLSAMVAGPSPRLISNRIFNDNGQNIFSENGISQWGWVWAQFLDHDMGLRDESLPAANTRRSTPTGGNAPPEPGGGGPSGASDKIPFDPNDPLEAFTNDLGAIDFSRTPAATGTGVASPREQINTITSFIDSSNVYGVTPSRLDWLRSGRLDGDPSNNAARLRLPGGFLPRVGVRGDPKTAPQMDLMGPLVGSPQLARVAGDVRANDNIALTAVQTLMAREHNRIVAALPASLPEEARFQIARRVVAAEVQYITYKQFLPALGVRLSRYRGYNPTVDPSLTNEFASVGFRGHSMVHGEFDVAFNDGDFSAAQLAALTRMGVTVNTEGVGGPSMKIPLNVAFGNPDLLSMVGLGRVLAALGAEREYRNDEQIDNTMRSVLFEVPKPGTPNPGACSAPVVNPQCFTGVQDLGAIDIARGRDHGMPSYNDMRRAYGLAPKRSFTAITGEATSQFPVDPKIDPRDPIDDPNILDFVDLRDAEGKPVQPGTDAALEQVVTATRRSTLAARLRGVYGSVDKVDAFVGMSAERHIPGTEFGGLELAIWQQQFTALRDGDRFFYAVDPLLPLVKRLYGITYQHTLPGLIALNTGRRVPRDVFHAPVEATPAKAK